MAGIGFELRKITDSKTGIIHRLTSYSFSIFSLNGPIISFFLCIAICGLIIGNRSIDGISSESIISTITYTFIFSSLLTSFFSLNLTRYISDCIYERSYHKIFPSLLGSVIPVLVISLFLFATLVYVEGLRLIYGILLSALFSVVLIIWIEMTYISAANNFKAITKGFFAGNFLTVVLMLVFSWIPEKYAIEYILFSFCIGFTLTSAMLLFQIRVRFGSGNGKLYEWVGYLKKYPSLIIIAVGYALGLYFVSLYYKIFSVGAFTKGFITPSSSFDLIFYLAFLLNVPGMVYFVIRIETYLYSEYVKLYSNLAHAGTAKEINSHIYGIKKIVQYSFYKIILFQTFVSLIMICVPMFILEKGNVFEVYLLSFIALCVGASGTTIMYCAKIVILYFDERVYAVFISVIYCILNIGLTLLLEGNSDSIKGLGFMIGSLISMIFSLICLWVFMKSLKQSILKMKH